jgi:predicted nucleic acid-binding protein
MTNDSLSAAMMAARRITHVASHDTDLHSLPGLTVVKPSDVRYTADS